jgi:hypothetical protein
MFDTEQFIADCRSALQEQDGRAAMREIVASAVAEPTAVVQALGEPKLALYRQTDRNVVNDILNRFLFVVRSTANKIIELSRGVVRAEVYGESNGWNGEVKAGLGLDRRRGDRFAICLSV